MKTYFMPCNLQSWSETKVDYFGSHIPVNPAPSMGKFFIPVFETEEALRKEFSNSGIMLVQMAETKNTK